MSTSTDQRTGPGSRQGAGPGQPPAALTLDEPTIGRLVADTSRHLSGLIRAEIALAKTELKISATAGGIGAALIAVAGLLAVLAVVMLSFAAAYFIVMAGLDEAWAFLIVFGFYLLVATVLALLALRRFKKVKPPEQTIATTKDTVATLRSR